MEGPPIAMKSQVPKTNGMSQPAPPQNGLSQLPDDNNGLSLEELAQLHEDIMDKDVDAVRDTILDFQEDNGPLLELISGEVTLEPLPEDHPLNGLPQGALHRATLADSVPILSLLLGAHPDANINQPMSSNGYSPLHVAVTAGITPLASYLASNGADVNARAHEGQTPIHLAGKYGTTDIAKILVVKGAAINLRDEKQRSPLHVAAFEGQVKMIAFLLKRGDAELGLVDVEGCSAVHRAQVKGFVETTEALIGAGLDLNLVNNNGDTAIMTNLQNFTEVVSSPSETNPDELSHITCLKLLLDAGCNANKNNKDGDTPLHVCAKFANVEAAKCLVKYRAKIDAVNDNGEPPIFHARANKVMDYFLEQGADEHHISKNGDSVLHAYSRAEAVGVEMLTELLSLGVDINTQNRSGDTALHCACEVGSPEKVVALIQGGCKTEVLNSKRKLPIQLALENKHEGVVSILIGNVRTLNNQDIYGKTLLHVAAEQENLNVVQKLTDSGADLNVVDKSGSNPASIAARKKSHNVLMFLLTKGAQLSAEFGKPLHYFAAEGFVDVVRILHAQGHDINAPDSQQRTALHCALDSGQWETAAYMLRAEANARTTAKNGDSPLHVAVRSCRDVNLIETLIENGRADVNAVDAMRRSPLHLAMEFNTLDVVMHLVEVGADVNLVDKSGNTAVHIGLIQALSPLNNNNEEHVETIQFLLESGTRVDVGIANKENRTVLHYVAKLGNDKLLKEIVTMKADVNLMDKQGQSALMNACEFGNLKCVEVLLKHRIQVNVRDENGESALLKATKSGASEIVDLLLQSEADPDSSRNDGTTSLHCCLQDKNYEILDILLSAGANLNKPDQTGLTALHVASNTAPHDIVRSLVGNGADIQSTDSKNWTALHFSALNKDKMVMSFLLRKGCDIEAKDCDGNTALHIASQEFNYDHVTTLLDDGADVNSTNSDGNTALHFAAKHRETDILELLISHEADVNFSNNFNETPFLVALSQGNINAAGILLDYDADIDVTDSSGESALHKVVRILTIRPVFVQCLARKGLSHLKQNDKGQTPLDILKSLNRDDEGVLIQALGVEELV